MLVFSAVLAAISLFWYCKLFVTYTDAWEQLKAPYESATDTKLSWTVIVPFRNENENLPKLVDSLNQVIGLDNTKLVEVLFINDHSTDDSNEVLQNVLQQASFRNRLLLSEGEGKKQAILTGARNSKSNYCLSLDADAFPPKAWFMAYQRMVSGSQYVFVAGPVVLSPAHNRFEQWQQLEFAGLIGITGAGIYRKNPTMSNGANLAFQREAFLSVQDELSEIISPSGDDQFLMHALAQKYGEGRIGFLKDKDAIVQTAPVKELKSFVIQRARWISKAGSYQRNHVDLELLGVFFFTLQIPLNLIGGLFFTELIWTGIVLLFVKFFVEYRFYSRVLPFFGLTHLKRIIWWSEAFQVIYICFIGILGKVMPIRWKGRTYA